MMIVCGFNERGIFFFFQRHVIINNSAEESFAAVYLGYLCTSFINGFCMVKTREILILKELDNQWNSIFNKIINFRTY